LYYKIISMKKHGSITEYEFKNILKRYFNGEKLNLIVKEYDVTISAIYKRMESRDIPRLSQSVTQRKYVINESFFDVINTEEKAYILGLMWADGCIRTKNNTVYIELQETDKDILLKIRNLIQPSKDLMFINKKNIKHKNTYRFTICNKHINNKLLLHGLCENKSFSIKPPVIDEELVNHFIRGFFDGDGCISSYLVKGKYKTSSFSITSNIEILNYIQNIFIAKLGLTKTKIQTDKRGNNICSLVYGGRNNCIKIKNYLYYNSTIYMDRKFKKFNEL